MAHLKIILTVALIATAMNFSFATSTKNGIPQGWTISKDTDKYFIVGIDPAESKDGQNAVFIESNSAATQHVGALTQTIDSSSLEKKNYELTFSYKTIGESTQASIWVRASDDNNKKNSVWQIGSQAPSWRTEKLKIQLRELPDSFQIGFGLRGKGKILVRDMKFSDAPLPSKDEQIKERRIDEEIPIGTKKPTLSNLNFAQ